MYNGVHRSGDIARRCFEHEYTGRVDHDVAIFYGLEGKMPQIFADYRSQAKAVYVDLGYWGRREGGRWSGYHKVSINDRHPTSYYRKRQHDADRLERFGIQVKPWRKTGSHILLAGMGDKGSQAEGYPVEQWEREAITAIRQVTDRPILYRPKPSWKKAKPIVMAGVAYSAPHAREVEDDLRDCWAVVTHHSNVAIDGLVAGIPAFCWRGVATEMALQDLKRIETPMFPDGREAWLRDIAYTQWSIAEMQSGAAWQHLKAEKLIP